MKKYIKTDIITDGSVPPVLTLSLAEVKIINYALALNGSNLRYVLISK